MREDDAGDAGQRQRRPEQRHRGENEENVDAQGDVGEDAENAVGRQHIDDHQRAADQRRALARVDRILAEAGADGALLDHGQLGRQRAGAQQHGEIVGLLDGEIAGDLARAAGDRPENARRRDRPCRRARWRTVGRHSPTSPAPNRWPPRRLKRKLTSGSPRARVEARLRVGQILARHHHPLLRPAACRPAAAAASRPRSAGRRDRRPGGTQAWRSRRAGP